MTHSLPTGVAERHRRLRWIDSHKHRPVAAVAAASLHAISVDHVPRWGGDRDGQRFTRCVDFSAFESGTDLGLSPVANCIDADAHSENPNDHSADNEDA